MDQFSVFVQVVKLLGIVIGIFLAWGKFSERMKEYQVEIAALKERVSKLEEQLDSKLDRIYDKIEKVDEKFERHFFK